MKNKKLIKNSAIVEKQKHTSDKPLPSFQSKRLDNVNYKREKLEKLMNYKKPFIVSATLKVILDDKYVFSNIKPYIGKINKNRIGLLCDHVNFQIKDVAKYIDISSLHEGIDAFLFCDVKIYRSKFNEKRYGLQLKEIESIRPIFFNEERIEEIPKELYLNFSNDVLRKLDIMVQPPKLK